MRRRRHRSSPLQHLVLRLLAALLLFGLAVVEGLQHVMAEGWPPPAPGGAAGVTLVVTFFAGAVAAALPRAAAWAMSAFAAGVGVVHGVVLGVVDAEPGLAFVAGGALSLLLLTLAALPGPRRRRTLAPRTQDRPAIGSDAPAGRSAPALR